MYVTVPFDFNMCLEKGRRLQAQGASDEEVLQLFRQEGAPMVESVRLIRQLKSISLREAQDIVYFSVTWADQKESHEKLQDAFVGALEQLSRENDRPLRVQGRSPDQIAGLRWAAVLLVVNVFLTLILSLVLKLERIPLLGILVALIVARYLYKLRPGTETATLGLAALATVAAPLLYFWRLPAMAAVFETVAVCGITGPLFLLLLGNPGRSRRIAAVVIFCIFRVGIYALAALASAPA